MNRRVGLRLALATLLLAVGRQGGAADLRLLAAGAAETVLRDTVGRFETDSGHTVTLTFGAVGALRDQSAAGAPADLTIVTPFIIEQPQARGLVGPDTRLDLGRVGRGIAVRRGRRARRSGRQRN